MHTLFRRRASLGHGQSSSAIDILQMATIRANIPDCDARLLSRYLGVVREMSKKRRGEGADDGPRSFSRRYQNFRPTHYHRCTKVRRRIQK
jgi:hypothetical protein